MSLVTAALEKLDADLAKCTEEVDALADGYVEWLVELKDQNVRLVQHSECASPASLSHAGPTRARLRGLYALKDGKHWSGLDSGRDAGAEPRVRVLPRKQARRLKKPSESYHYEARQQDQAQAVQQSQD